MPLRRIWAEDVASNPLIISHHIDLKPTFFNTSSKKSPRYRVKSLRDVKLEENARLLLLMEKMGCLLNEHEVILDEPLLDKG
jgi:hypothetical protein